MSKHIERVEIITGRRRRRRYPAEEKVRLVEETTRPGMTVSTARIDVQRVVSSISTLDVTGRIIGKAKVASGPEALVAFLAGCGHRLALIGLKAGPRSQNPHAGPVERRPARQAGASMARSIRRRCAG